MVQTRRLTVSEIALAREVYAAALPFERIFITDLDLGGAVTLAGMDLATRRFDYTINWIEAFGGIVDFASRRSTFIHELCHVWQGENGVWPTFYMGQSIWAQLRSGVQDIWRTRQWRGWGTHRSTAYPFPASVIGNDWSTFNVEQQASLVESWYIPERERVIAIGGNRVRIHDFGPGVHDGGRSVHDARFPYIRDCRRAAIRRSRPRRIAWSRSAISTHAMPMA